VDIATIALWLGHESIETTHVYLEVDLAHKEQALQKLAAVEGDIARFRADDPLLRIPVIPATQSGAKLPPNPKEACHAIRTKAAPLGPPSERSDA